MYILFESYTTDPDALSMLSAYDAMGYTDNEETAMAWVAANRDYRAYKYCPKNPIVLVTDI